jgi:hypothetical protein
MRSTNLKRTARGFVRSIGPASGQVKFYLGHDREQAQAKIDKIMALWGTVEDEASLRGLKPSWSPDTLVAAKAIAAGEVPSLQKRPYESPERYFTRVNEIGQKVGMTVQPADPFLFDVGRQDLADTIAEAQAHLSPAVGVPKATGQTLHQAFRSYLEYLRREYRTGEDSITDNGKTKIDQIISMRAYVPDLDLGALDYRVCDELFGIFRRRPVSKRYGKPMTRKSCSNLIGELGRFFLWLHTSPDWSWRRPEDFDLIKRAPRELDADVERAAAPVPTWTVEQLAILYKYALPLERVFLLLGLNCAYGADQAGRLRVPHLHLSEDGRNYIRRIRRKKKVLAIHLLWVQTNLAMNWALERRKSQQHDEDFLLLTDNGLPYWRQTKGGNRCQLIPNLWRRLLDRVGKDHPEFPRLPFNSLRDTSCDMIRAIAGEETASVHVAHKHQSKDENLGRYSNPVRRRHFKALRVLERKLAPVFAAAGPDPFTPVRKNYIGLEKVKKIKELHAEGVPIMEITRKLAVSQGTVYRYIDK